MSAIGLPHASSASSLPQNVPSDSTSPRVPTALTRQPSTSLCAPSLTSLSLPTPPAITSAAPQAVLGTVNWSVHSASVDVALTCNLLRFQLEKFKEKKLKNKILSSVPLKLTTCILDTCYSHLFSALGVVAVDNAKYITRRVPRARLENVFGPEWWIVPMFAGRDRIADGWFAIAKDKPVLIRYYRQPSQKLVIEAQFLRFPPTITQADI